MLDFLETNHSKTDSLLTYLVPSATTIVILGIIISKKIVSKKHVHFD